MRAYQTLAQYQGQGIPKFHGSYSLCIPVPGSSLSREVKMVLVQYIKGPSMLQLMPEQLPQLVRQHIFRKMLDLESSIFEKDVDLVDLAPRNTILIRTGEDRPEVVLIDFGDTQFRCDRDYWDGEGSKMFQGQYISPLLRWKGGPPPGFESWVDWEWDSWLLKEFADTERTITPEMRKHWARGRRSIGGNA